MKMSTSTSRRLDPLLFAADVIPFHPLRSA